MDETNTTDALLIHKPFHTDRADERAGKLVVEPTKILVSLIDGARIFEVAEVVRSPVLTGLDAVSPTLNCSVIELVSLHD